MLSSTLAQRQKRKDGRECSDLRTRKSCKKQGCTWLRILNVKGKGKKRKKMWECVDSEEIQDFFDDHYEEEEELDVGNYPGNQGCEATCEGLHITKHACKSMFYCEWDDNKCWSAVGTEPCPSSEDEMDLHHDDEVEDVDHHDEDEEEDDDDQHDEEEDDDDDHHDEEEDHHHDEEEEEDDDHHDDDEEEDHHHDEEEEEEEDHHHDEEEEDDDDHHDDDEEDDDHHDEEEEEEEDDDDHHDEEEDDDDHHDDDEDDDDHHGEEEEEDDDHPDEEEEDDDDHHDDDEDEEEFCHELSKKECKGERKCVWEIIRVAGRFRKKIGNCIFDHERTDDDVDCSKYRKKKQCKKHSECRFVRRGRDKKCVEA